MDLILKKTLGISRKIVGYLPETPPLYPELTIGRYLRFIAELHDLSDPRMKVGSVMEQLGLSGWEDQNYSLIIKRLQAKGRSSTGNYSRSKDFNIRRTDNGIGSNTGC